MSERKISVKCGDVQVTALLNDGDTASMIWDALPIAAQANTWGDEIYFSIPVDAPLDADASDVVDMGAVAYWPPGGALCLFFGRTPASVGDECRAASAVNVVGAVEGNVDALKRVRSGARIDVDRI